MRRSEAPNGLELSCPAEAGRLALIVAPAGGPRALPYGPARRVSFSELLGGADSSAAADAEIPDLRETKRKVSPRLVLENLGEDRKGAEFVPGYPSSFANVLLGLPYAG